MSKAMIKVEQIGSPIRRHRRQRATLIGLGLNRIGRSALVPDTWATRGMIAKVRHLVRVVPEDPGNLKRLSRRRFEALAGYIRDPSSILVFEELEWHATFDERVIGMLIRDNNDGDFGWIILGRDERLRFRAIDAGSSLALQDSADAARAHQRGHADQMIEQVSDVSYWPETSGGKDAISAKCHVSTAPSWQELSSRKQHWSVQPCVRP